MGYSYFFLITIEDRGGVDPDVIEAKWFPQFKAAYNRFSSVTTQLQLNKGPEVETWFPTFSEVEHSSAGGFGTGPRDEMLASFGKFTQLFPQFAFGLYLFWWDCTKLAAYTIQGNMMLAKQEWDLEAVKVLNNELTLSVAPDAITLPSDITHVFGSKYRTEETEWK